VAVIDQPPVRFVILDSLIRPNETPGLLGQSQRLWLDEFLVRSGNTPTLLFVHHTLGDDDGSLLDADRFLRIASKHACVKAVFYGHSHVYRYDTLEGMHLVNVPAVGYNFRDNQPVGWLEAAITAEGADLKLNAIGGNTEAHAKTRSLGWRA
jgi:3',5'-cyclic AMP phosphodiesterase CpdA